MELYRLMEQTSAVASVTDPLEVGLGNIKAPQMTEEEARELAEVVAGYRVEAEPDAPGVCIDGRNCVHCLGGGETRPGPKVAGGPLMTGYVAAKLTGWFSESDPQDFENQLTMVANSLVAGGIKLGAHCDTKAEAEEFVNGTGCKANDAVAQIQTNMEHAPEFIVAGVALLFEEPDHFVPELAEAAVQAGVQDPLHGWNPMTLLRVLQKHDPTAKNIEVLLNQGGPTGGHFEALLTPNFKHSTTVDRDRLWADRKIQVFPPDVWYIDDIAKALARGPQSQSQYEAIRHAGRAFQAAALLTLADETSPFRAAPLN